jgi:hypothetical protein
VTLCGSHWEALKDAIKLRGLWPFVAGNSDEAARRYGADEFDPLVHATIGIYSNALSAAGLGIAHETSGEQAVEPCPICFLLAQCRCGLGSECRYAGWIDAAADAALARARVEGLVVAS